MAEALPRHLAKPGPASVRAFRVSAGALLLAERRTRAELQGHVNDVALQVAGEAAQRRKAIERAALLLLILQSSRHMADVLGQGIRTGRQRARDVAADRLKVELAAAKAPKAARGVVKTYLSHADEVHAQTSADSLAVQWRTRTVHAATRAVRREEDLIKVLAESGPKMSGSVYRTAATETAQAYNEGRVDAGVNIRAGSFVREETDEGELAGAEPEPETEAGLFGGGDEGGGTILDPLGDEADFILVDRWDSILDAKTCPECAAYDGTLVHFAEPFVMIGDEPGYVHPWCRCLRTTLAVPLSSVDMSIAAQARMVAAA